MLSESPIGVDNSIEYFYLHSNSARLRTASAGAGAVKGDFEAVRVSDRRQIYALLHYHFGYSASHAAFRTSEQVLQSQL